MRVDKLEIDGKKVEIIHNLKMYSVDIFQLLSSYCATTPVQTCSDFIKFVHRIDPRFKCVKN